MKVFEDLARHHAFVIVIVFHKLVNFLVKDCPHGNNLGNLEVFIAVDNRTYIFCFLKDLLLNRIIRIHCVFSYHELFRSLAQSALNAQVFFLARCDKCRSCDEVGELVYLIDAILCPLFAVLKLLHRNITIRALLTRMLIKLFGYQCHRLIKAVDVLLDYLKRPLLTFFNFFQKLLAVKILTFVSQSDLVH